MPRDEATVDRIFAGDLGDLPPLSSKVTTTQLISPKHQNSEIEFPGTLPCVVLVGSWPRRESCNVLFHDSITFQTQFTFAKLNIEF